MRCDCNAGEYPENIRKNPQSNVYENRSKTQSCHAVLPKPSLLWIHDTTHGNRNNIWQFGGAKCPGIHVTQYTSAVLREAWQNGRFADIKLFLSASSKTMCLPLDFRDIRTLGPPARTLRLSNPFGSWQVATPYLRDSIVFRWNTNKGSSNKWWFFFFWKT